MRKAFTLIELLVVIGVMGLMAAVGISSVRGGQKYARLRGATRNVFAVIRNARSQALVTQIPVVVTYSNETVDEEPTVKIEVKSEKMFVPSSSNPATLSGYPLENADDDSAAVGAESDGAITKDGGEALEDTLFAPISQEVVKGVRIKVAMEDDLAYDPSAKGGRSKISFFSNVDYLDTKFSEKDKKPETTSETEKKPEKTADDALTAEEQKPVKVLWQTNGRTDPHRIWVYADGSEPESGLSIRIDRFGAAKVLQAGEDE